MKKIIIALFFILGFAPAQAMVIDTFQLDMNAGSGGGGLFGVNSNVALTHGVSYLVTVSGTFEIGCLPGGCPTDAEYYWPLTSPYNGVTPFDNTGLSNTDGVGIDIGVKLDNIKVDWGAPNPAHIYSYLFVGTGNTLFVNYQDTNYGDNSGFLDIKIETIASNVPEPASFTLMMLGLAALSFSRVKLN